MPSIVTQRFVECYQQCKEQGLVRSGRQFAFELKFQPQNLSEILRGKRDAPSELIRKAVERFDFNPQYLYTGEGCMLGKKSEDQLKVLTVMTDAAGRERIVHIPVPAQAGYSLELEEPQYFEHLPSYSLPDHRYSIGSYRSFDVAGDSMEPTLRAGDKVICHFVEPNQWVDGIKDHHVYVVVGRHGVVVKRLVNHLRKHRHIALHSDNAHYQPKRLNVSEVKEIWMVATTISDFSHTLPETRKEAAIEALHETIGEQSALIHELSNKLEKFLLPT